MLYTGSVSDRCAITFADVKELHNPVGFNSSHAFECDNLLRWLRMGKMTNPITAEAIASESLAIEVLSPLVIDGDRTHLETTREKLRRAGRLRVRITNELFPRRSQ